MNHSGHPTVLPTLYMSPTHPCGYLPFPNAATMFVDTSWPMDSRLYEWLLEMGFRRSGSHVYRPFCPGCIECVPVRLPVEQFVPKRSFQRVWEKNRDLSVAIKEAQWSQEYFDLYKYYLEARHGGGPMAAPKKEDFLEFLLCRWGDTRFVEFRLGQRLLAVAVMDVLPNSLSAAYTFFDPDEQHRSLGSLAILWQVQHALYRKQRWLYLGYWIENCRKMSYKIRFQPLEAYSMHQWKRLRIDLP